MLIAKQKAPEDVNNIVSQCSYGTIKEIIGIDQGERNELSSELGR